MCRSVSSCSARIVKVINKLTHTAGKFAGKKFNLRRFQEAVVRLITGTLDAEGKRIIRTVFIMIPRKNGKTELMAALMIALLLIEDQQGKQETRKPDHRRS